MHHSPWVSKQNSSFTLGNEDWNCLIPHSDDWQMEVASRALTTTCKLPSGMSCPDLIIKLLLATQKRQIHIHLVSGFSKHCLQLFINVSIICQGTMLHSTWGIESTNIYCTIHPKDGNARNIMAMQPAIIKILCTLTSFVDWILRLRPSRVPQTSGREWYFATVACW